MSRTRKQRSAIRPPLADTRERKLVQARALSAAAAAAAHAAAWRRADRLAREAATLGKSL